MYKTSFNFMVVFIEWDLSPPPYEMLNDYLKAQRIHGSKHAELGKALNHGVVANEVVALDVGPQR